MLFFLKKNGPIPAPFSVYFCLFYTLQFKFKLKKAYVVCLGFEPGAAGWKARTNPLSYGGTPSSKFKCCFHQQLCLREKCSKCQSRVFQTKSSLAQDKIQNLTQLPSPLPSLFIQGI